MHTVVASEMLKPEEQDVLRIAGRNGGKVEISSRSDTRGPAVRAGKEKLYNQQNRTYAQQCCEAISTLIELQLLRSGGVSNQYELTNFGWQISRKLTIKKSEGD